MRKTTIIVMFLLVLIMPIFASDLEESLENLSGRAAKEYIRPVANVFGPSVNAGWFNDSPKAKIFGINAEFGFIATVSNLSGDKSFSVNSDFGFSQSQAEDIVNNSSIDPALKPYAVDAVLNQDLDVTISGPTIIGQKDDKVKVLFPAQPVEVNVNGETQTVNLAEYEIELPVKAIMHDWDVFPMATPQLKLGTVYGTQITLRALPPYDVQDLGKMTYFGVGIQHNPLMWMKIPLPINIALAYYTQTLEIENTATTTASTYGVTASKQFGLKMFNITPYAGLMMDSSNIEVSYEFTTELDDGVTDVEKIKFEMEGEDSTRLVLGSSFRSGFFKLNTEYSLSNTNSFSAGVSFVF